MSVLFERRRGLLASDTLLGESIFTCPRALPCAALSLCRCDVDLCYKHHSSTLFSNIHCQCSLESRENCLKIDKDCGGGSRGMRGARVAYMEQRVHYLRRPQPAGIVIVRKCIRTRLKYGAGFDRGTSRLHFSSVRFRGLEWSSQRVLENGSKRIPTFRHPFAASV